MKHKFTIPIFGITTALLTGCAGPTFKVTSDSPARIEAEGVTACKTTPCKINGMHYKNGYGQCIRGANTHLEAFPLSNSGTVQSKQIFGDCDKEYSVYFEMSSTRGIKTYEGNNRSSTKDSKEALKSRLKKLDDLLEDKVISPQEHKNRRQQILNEI